MTPLVDFLRWSAGAPSVWGELDCFWWAERWLRARSSRPDFADALRAKYAGRYRSALGCERILRQAGGLAAVAAELAAAAGLRPVAAPARGDLVIVALESGREVIGVAVDADRSAVKRWPRGVAVVRRPIVAAWGAA